MATELKPDERHWKAAELYLSGPSGVRGNWKAACREAGFKRTPGIDNKTSQHVIEETRNSKAGVDDALLELEMLLETGEPEWDEVAPVARKVLTKIGAGLIEADSGQISALKEMIARAEGRVGSEGAGGPQGVVVLPALVDQDRLPYVDAESEESIGEAHNRLARQAARGEAWEDTRSIPGGWYKDDDE